MATLAPSGETGVAMDLPGARGHRFAAKGHSGFEVGFVADASGTMSRMPLHRSATSTLATRR